MKSRATTVAAHQDAFSPARRGASSAGAHVPRDPNEPFHSRDTHESR